MRQNIFLQDCFILTFMRPDIQFNKIMLFPFSEIIQQDEKGKRANGQREVEA